MAERSRRVSVFQEAVSRWRNNNPALEAYYAEDLENLQRILTEDPSYISGTKETFKVPLCLLAAREDRADVLQLLIAMAGGSVEHLQYKDDRGKNCLHTAIRHKSLGAASVLLENGFDPNEVDSEGQTPLNAACIIEDCRFVEILLQAGADCNIPDEAGNLPIHQACQEDEVHIVRALLTNTKDINARGAFGRTPLHCAALAQSLPLLRLLLNKKAAVRVYDEDQLSPMDILLRMGNQNLLAGLSDYFTRRVAADYDSMEDLLQSGQFSRVLDILDAIDDDLENPLESPLLSLNLPVGEINEEEQNRMLHRIESFDKIDFIEFRQMVITIAKEGLSDEIVQRDCVSNFAQLVSKHILFKEDSDMLNILLFGTTLWPKIQCYLETDIPSMYETCSEIGSTGMVALMKKTIFDKETKLWREDLMLRFFHKRLNLPNLYKEQDHNLKFMRNPARTLPLWSVMSGRFHLTEDLLKGEQFDMLPIGLFCVCLLRKLNLLKEIPRPTKKVMEQVADRVESVCSKLIREVNVLDTTEKKMVAINFIRLRLPLYNDFTCMGLASAGQCESFMVMPSVQASVDREWYKRLYHSGSAYRELLIAIGLIPFNPLLFFLLRSLWIATSHMDSSNPEEVARMDRLEFQQEDDSDDEDEEKEKADAAKLDEGIDQSNMDLIDKASRAEAKKKPIRKETVMREGGHYTSGNPLLDFMALYFRTMIGFYFTPAVKFHYHILAHIIFICTFSYIVVAHFQYHISIAEIIVYLFLLGFFLEELHEMNEARGNGSLFGYFSDGWNLLDNTGLFLSLVGFCMRMAMVHNQSKDFIYHYGFTDVYYWWTRFVLQMACLVYWMRLLYVSTVMETLGPKLKMISVMITRDFVPFMIMLAIMMFGFGVMIRGLMYPNRYSHNNSKPQSYSETFQSMFKITFYAMVGEFGLSDLAGEDCSDKKTCPHPLSIIFVPNVIMCIYIIIVNVLLLNLIVASFSKTVDEIDKKSFAMWQFERYDLLAEFMVRSPLPPPLSILGEIFRWGITFYEYATHSELILRRRTFSKNRIINFLTLQAFSLRNRRKRLVGDIEVDDPEKLVPEMARKLKRLHAKLSNIKARVGVKDEE